MNIYNMYHFLKANNKTLFFLNQSFFCVATEDEDKGAALKTAQLSFSGSCCQHQNNNTWWQNLGLRKSKVKMSAIFAKIQVTLLVAKIVDKEDIQ